MSLLSFLMSNKTNIRGIVSIEPQCCKVSGKYRRRPPLPPQKKKQKKNTHTVTHTHARAHISAAVTYISNIEQIRPLCETRMYVERKEWLMISLQCIPDQFVSLWVIQQARVSHRSSRSYQFPGCNDVRFSKTSQTKSKQD